MGGWHFRYLMCLLVTSIYQFHLVRDEIENVRRFTFIGGSVKCHPLISSLRNDQRCTCYNYVAGQRDTVYQKIRSSARWVLYVLSDEEPTSRDAPKCITRIKIICSAILLIRQYHKNAILFCSVVSSIDL